MQKGVALVEQQRCMEPGGIESPSWSLLFSSVHAQLSVRMYPPSGSAWKQTGHLHGHLEYTTEYTTETWEKMTAT